MRFSKFTLFLLYIRAVLPLTGYLKFDSNAIQRNNMNSNLTADVIVKIDCNGTSSNVIITFIECYRVFCLLKEPTEESCYFFLETCNRLIDSFWL